MNDVFGHDHNNTVNTKHVHYYCNDDAHNGTILIFSIKRDWFFVSACNFCQIRGKIMKVLNVVQTEKRARAIVIITLL